MAAATAKRTCSTACGRSANRPPDPGTLPRRAGLTRGLAVSRAEALPHVPYLVANGDFGGQHSTGRYDPRHSTIAIRQVRCDFQPPGPANAHALQPVKEAADQRA